MIKFLFLAILFASVTFCLGNFLLDAKGNLIRYTQDHNINDAITMVYNISVAIIAAIFNIGTLLMFLIASVNSKNKKEDDFLVEEFT